MSVDDVAGNGYGRYRLPGQRTPCDSRNEGFRCVSMTWRATRQAESARHVRGCHVCNTRNEGLKCVSMTWRETFA